MRLTSQESLAQRLIWMIQKHWNALVRFRGDYYSNVSRQLEEILRYILHFTVHLKNQLWILIFGILGSSQFLTQSRQTERERIQVDGNVEIWTFGFSPFQRWLFWSAMQFFHSFLCDFLFQIQFDLFLKAERYRINNLWRKSSVANPFS